MMNKIVLSLSLWGCFAIGHLLAQTTATQTVTMVINAIDAISVTASGSWVNLIAPAAGSPIASDTDVLSSIAYTTNTAARKITVSLDTNTPANTTLTLYINATVTGATRYTVTLDTTARTLCNAMTKANQTNRTLLYTWSATCAAAPFATTTRTATFTILAGP